MVNRIVYSRTGAAHSSPLSNLPIRRAPQFRPTAFDISSRAPGMRGRAKPLGAAKAALVLTPDRRLRR